MRLRTVVAGLVLLGFLIPAMAVLLAVIMWDDRPTAATAGAVAFLVISIPLALLAARRFHRPSGGEGPVEL